MHIIRACLLLALASYAATQGVLGPPAVICERHQGNVSSI